MKHSIPFHLFVLKKQDILYSDIRLLANSGGIVFSPQNMSKNAFAAGAPPDSRPEPPTWEIMVLP